MQLNYERRVAVLLHQSDRVLSAQLKRKASRIEEVEDEDGEDSRCLDKKLKSLNSSHKGSSSSSSSSGDNAITTEEMMNMMEAASKEGEAIFNSLLGPIITLTPDTAASSSQDISAPLDIAGPSGGDATGSGGSGARTHVTGAHLDVAQIFKKKKADSKKLLAQSLASEYNPLDFMDWTARSL